MLYEVITITVVPGVVDQIRICNLDEERKVLKVRGAVIANVTRGDSYNFV